MKRKISVIILTAIFAIAAMLGLTACDLGGGEDVVTPDEEVTINNMGEWTTVSPDGTIDATVVQDAYGEITLSVKKGDDYVLRPSAIGLDIEEDDFGFLTFQRKATESASGSYDNISGKVAHVDYTYNQTTVTFKAWNFVLDVVVRCYDDGYALRYNVRKTDGSEGYMTVNTEKTAYTLPEESTIWGQKVKYSSTKNGLNFFSYEENYTKINADSLVSTDYYGYPVMYNVPDTDYYSLISESELIGSNFYGSVLKAPVGTEGEYILKTEHSPAGAKIDDNQVAYPFESPWRVGIIGDMKTVQESELIETVYYSGEEDYTDLYWKPDNYDELSAEEQAIYDYDWVDADLGAWSWLANGGANSQYNYALHRDYLNLAVQMGWKYVVLDANWGVNQTSEHLVTKQFCQEANALGIKVLVWYDSLNNFGNGDIEVLKAKLDHCVSLGISGLKIDFFDGQRTSGQTHQGEDIETIQWYETIYQECAKRKMVVNCHGCNKPTGERVKYPNVINREAVKGNENKKIAASDTINLLFLRGVIGPSDFTPVVNPLSANLTYAHQLAMSVLFESGLPSMADLPEAYLGTNVQEFFTTLPALRDKTVYLGGRLDSHYMAAVKGGDYWYVGVANSIVEQDLTIDFSFLDDDGTYVAEIYADKQDAETASENGKSLVISTITVTKESKETFHILEKGGLAIRLYKKA